MSHRYQTLLTPLVLPNGAVLKNRIVQPKCAPDQIQGPEEWPTEQFIHFHRESTRRGNSLVILCDAFRPEVRKMPAWHDFSHSYSFNLADPAVHNHCQLADDAFYLQGAGQHPPGVSPGGLGGRPQRPPGCRVPRDSWSCPRGSWPPRSRSARSLKTTSDRLKEYADWGMTGPPWTEAGADGLYGPSGTTSTAAALKNRCRFILELCKRIKEKCADPALLST